MLFEHLVENRVGLKFTVASVRFRNSEPSIIRKADCGTSSIQFKPLRRLIYRQEVSVICRRLRGLSSDRGSKESGGDYDYS